MNALIVARNVSKYKIISGSYFPLFGLNTKIYEVNLHIQSEYRKIRTRNNSVFGRFSRSAYEEDYLKKFIINKLHVLLRQSTRDYSNKSHRCSKTLENIKHGEFLQQHIKALLSRISPS